MRRPGEVTEVRNGMLQVTFCRPDACQSCGACEGGKKQTVIWVRGEARVGDIAVVDLPDKTVVKASLTAYGLPLVFLLLGLILGGMVTPDSEIGGVIGALIGLGGSLAVLKATEKKRKTAPGWNPEVIEILPKNAAKE